MAPRRGRRNPAFLARRRINEHAAWVVRQNPTRKCTTKTSLVQNLCSTMPFITCLCGNFRGAVATLKRRADATRLRARFLASRDAENSNRSRDVGVDRFGDKGRATTRSGRDSYFSAAATGRKCPNPDLGNHRRSQLGRPGSGHSMISPVPPARSVTKAGLFRARATPGPHPFALANSLILVGDLL